MKRPVVVADCNNIVYIYSKSVSITSSVVNHLVKWANTGTSVSPVCDGNIRPISKQATNQRFFAKGERSRIKAFKYRRAPRDRVPDPISPWLPWRSVASRSRTRSRPTAGEERSRQSRRRCDRLGVFDRLQFRLDAADPISNNQGVDVSRPPGHLGVAPCPRRRRLSEYQTNHPRRPRWNRIPYPTLPYEQGLQ